MNEQLRTEYPEQQIERLARQAIHADDRFYVLGGVPYAIEHEGEEVKARCLLADWQALERYEEEKRIQKQGHPDHIEGAAKLESGDSLIEWCRRFGCTPERSALFAKRGPGTIQAIADYHRDGGQASWQRHRAIFASMFTEAATVWLKQVKDTDVSADGLDQLIRRWGFAIVDQAATVGEDGYKPSLRVQDCKGKTTLAPSAGDLMAWSASLGWSEQEEATIDRAAGTIKSSKTTAGSAFDRCGFWLRFPIFLGEESVDVEIGIAPRIVKGKLLFSLWPARGSSVIDEAFKAMGERIATATGLYLFEGDPEAPQVMP